MKKLVVSFLILFGAFSFGIFAGEWIIDILLSNSRDPLKTEVVQSIIIGCIVAFLFVMGNKSLKKKEL